MESNSIPGMCVQICTTKVDIFVWTLQVLGEKWKERERTSSQSFVCVITDQLQIRNKSSGLDSASLTVLFPWNHSIIT